MTPDVVVDIGNTRIKCGFCHAGQITSSASLDADDSHSWERSLPDGAKWGTVWVVASVHPERLVQLQKWASDLGVAVHVIDNFRQLALQVNVELPERVGIDRLQNAVAAKCVLPVATPGIVVDVGTAVTIDYLDADHVFQGGAILPGPRLMFEAMHRHTAKLPLIATHEIPRLQPPGKNTHDAMSVGVMAAQIGAVEFLVRDYASRFATPPWLFITGGAVGSLHGHNFPGVDQVVFDPLLTLKGILLAAEGLL